MKNKIDLFVPGRLCIFGEHSDWAGRHRLYNSDIVEGHAIVTGIEQGIYATAEKDNDLVIIDKSNDKKFALPMDLTKLEQEAKSGSYFSYICGVAAYMKKNYPIEGLKIVITKMTLPMKRGLSSSAACCVMIARAFNQLYNLNLSIEDEMQIAYLGETKTPSRCGKLDQVCAFGNKPVSLVFDGDDMTIKPIKIGTDFPWVFADLLASKNTKKILSDLNACYPFTQNTLEENVQKYLGPINKEINEKALKYFAEGNIIEMGNLLNYAQECFNKYLVPASDALKAPVLNRTLNDPEIKKLTYGGKGVGSQGDGCVQFLAKDASCQKKLIAYLNQKLHMNAYPLTLHKNNEIKKAIIPIAGKGTKMYPITQLFPKCLLPVYDKGLIKPTLMILLEDLDKAGIEEIYLVIDKNDKSIYQKMLSNPFTNDEMNKLTKEMLEYEKSLQRISKKIRFIYQEAKLGLGHAVYLCKKYIKNEPFLLLLGDQIYRSHSNASCVGQVLDKYNQVGNSIISAYEVPLAKTPMYGIMAGQLEKEKNQFVIQQFIEKPNIDYAEEHLGMKNFNGEKCYYAVFGIYALAPQIFDILEDMVNNHKQGQGEIQITSAINKLREQSSVMAFIPNGQMYDIGTPDNYKKTWSLF